MSGGGAEKMIKGVGATKTPKLKTKTTIREHS